MNFALSSSAPVDPPTLSEIASKRRQNKRRHAASALRISSSIGNSLILQKNGDVAIGTSNPQAKLHVQVSPNMGTAVAGYTGGGTQGKNFAAGVFGENDGTSGTGV